MLKNELFVVTQKVDLCLTMFKEYKKYYESTLIESLGFELIELQGMVRTLQRVEEIVIDVEENLGTRRHFFRANRIAEVISQQVQIVLKTELGLKRGA